MAGFDISQLLPGATPPAPPAGHALRIHRIGAADEINEETELDMSQETLLAALKKRSPVTRKELESMTGLESKALSNAIFNARKAKKIVCTGKGKHTGYSLAEAAKLVAGPKSAARKPRTMRIPKTRLAAPMATPSPFDPAPAPMGRNAREVQDFNLFTSPLEATSLPPRAIRKADGGAIIIRGNMVTAELDADTLAVVRQL